MPEGKPRIIIEKSSTVRRRYQRSDKRFKFTAKQLKQIEREEELDRRSKEIREKEKRRLINKKKRAEQEAKTREEAQKARRQGLPDPSAKIPSSQPLLSKFLGFASRPGRTEESPAEESPVEEPICENVSAKASPEPTTTEPIAHNDDGDTEVDSVVGDTEPDSDGFDDLDEELEYEISALEDAGAPEESKSPQPAELDNSKDTLDTVDDDDEFSDCSAFYDDEIIKEVEAAAATKGDRHEVTSPPINRPPINPALLQPPASDQPKTNPLASLNESFRDETADFLEDVFSRGCGESFGELIQLG